MWLPTKNQVDAASRHAISIAGTAIVIFGLQAKGISLDQLKDVITAFGGVVNDVVVLLAALAPLYAALKAAHTASASSQVAAVKAMATGPGSDAAMDAQHAIINAAGAIAADRTIPTSQAAANVLVAATAALPQVQTIVTDRRTADASPSPSVVPAQAA